MLSLCGYGAMIHSFVKLVGSNSSESQSSSSSFSSRCLLRLLHDVLRTGLARYWLPEFLRSTSSYRHRRTGSLRMQSLSATSWGDFSLRNDSDLRSLLKVMIAEINKNEQNCDWVRSDALIVKKIDDKPQRKSETVKETTFMVSFPLRTDSTPFDTPLTCSKQT